MKQSANTATGERKPQCELLSKCRHVQKNLSNNCVSKECAAKNLIDAFKNRDLIRVCTQNHRKKYGQSFVIVILGPCLSHYASKNVKWNFNEQYDDHSFEIFVIRTVLDKDGRKNKKKLHIKMGKSRWQTEFQIDDTSPVSFILQAKLPD